MRQEPRNPTVRLLQGPYISDLVLLAPSWNEALRQACMHLSEHDAQGADEASRNVCLVF